MTHGGDKSHHKEQPYDKKNGTWSHVISAHLWAKEAARVSLATWSKIQSYLHNETPIKTLDIEAPVSFPRWQYSV